MTSRSLATILIVLPATILGASLPAPSAASSSGAEIAIIPGQEWMDNGESIAKSQHLNPNAIYLYRKGATHPELILDRPIGTLRSPELSRGGKLLAYCFRVMTASGVRGVAASEVPWVIVSSPTGSPIDSIRGGTYFAWSATGESLAVLIPGGLFGIRDSMVIWRSATKSKDRYAAGHVIIHSGWLAVSQGSLAPPAFPAEVGFSPDGAYWTLAYPSIANTQTYVLEDSSRAELARAVLQAVADTDLIRTGRICWLSGKPGHVLALSVQDMVHHEPKDGTIKTRIAMVDVGWPQLLGWLPGSLTGLSADRQYLVIARDGELVFVPWKSIHWNEGQGAESRAPQIKNTVRFEVSVNEWGGGRFLRGDNNDRWLGGTSVELATGERFGMRREWLKDQWPEYVGGGFRLVRAYKDGSALIDPDLGLDPGERGQVTQRVLVSRSFVSLGTNSSDAGLHMVVRTLPDGASR